MKNKLLILLIILALPVLCMGAQRYSIKSSWPINLKGKTLHQWGGGFGFDITGMVSGNLEIEIGKRDVAGKLINCINFPVGLNFYVSDIFEVGAGPYFSAKSGTLKVGGFAALRGFVSPLYIEVKAFKENMYSGISLGIGIFVVED